ncbi:disulfide bond formation protein B [Pararhodobacter sp. SW119]|uniref:disulfide bond formation protein B n=1 Tax=Pararhodobacter sp. SW119 TaxID=2780075 RepID=UPI001ADFBEFA
MTRTTLALAAALGSAFLLIAALVFQYGFGMAPCALCIWQRWPHLAAVVLGGLALAAPALPVLLAGAAAAATSGGIGVYHTGVERGWFDGPSACSGGGGVTGQSIDDLLNFEQSFQVVRCDEVPWEMLGLSMASWNAAASFALAGVWLIAAARR